MKTLINQCSNMADEELLTAYKRIVEKVSRIMLNMNIDGMGGFDTIDKLEQLKGKYSYLEQEIESRELTQDLSIGSVDITALRIAEVEKLNALIAGYE